MTMRSYHGALLLILAMVMALLSTGICTAPVPAPTPAPSSEEYQLTCLEVLSKSGCDRKACQDDCLTKLKGKGVCILDGCWCQYPCKSPLLPPSPASPPPAQ